jgi:TonB family protein
MEKGKRTCEVLKAVRLEIAKANDIKYEPRECHHEGPCAGTCPACEAEVKYLEQQLQVRRMLGRAVMLTGIAVGLTSLTACGQNKLPNGCENDTTITEPELAGDVEDVDGMMEMPEPEVEEAVRGKMPAPVDTIRPINNDEKVLTGVVEYQPQFPGGIKACEQFIKENLRYPDTESDVQGRVIVSFMVERDGSLSNIKVVRGLDPAFDEEALRVVKMMPKWSPGATDGKISVMRYTIPIIFKKE